MTLWDNCRLDLGDMGQLLAVPGLSKRWDWLWLVSGIMHASGPGYKSEASARRAAESWIRAALQQAGEQIGG